MRLVLAILLGTIVGFVLNAVSWELLPWHHAAIGAAHDEVAAIECMGAQLEAPGVYLVPNPAAQQGDARAASLRQLVDGPAAFVAWRTGSFDMGAMFAKELARQLVAASALAIVLLGFVGHGLRRQLVAAAVIGGFAAAIGHMRDWIHFYAPGPFVLLDTLDAIVSAVLVGFVVAKVGARRA